MTTYYEQMFKSFTDALIQWYHWDSLKPCFPLSICMKDLNSIYYKLIEKDDKDFYNKCESIIHNINRNAFSIARSSQLEAIKKDYFVYIDKFERLYVKHKNGYIHIDYNQYSIDNRYQCFYASKNNKFDVDEVVSPLYFLQGYEQFVFPKFNLIAACINKPTSNGMSFGADIKNVCEIRFIGYNFSKSRFSNVFPMEAKMLQMLISKRNDIKWELTSF